MMLLATNICTLKGKFSQIRRYYSSYQLFISFKLIAIRLVPYLICFPVSNLAVADAVIMPAGSYSAIEIKIKILQVITNL